MSTSKMAALILFVIAVVIFVLVGFSIVETSDYDLVALGLASFVSGYILQHYVP